MLNQNQFAQTPVLGQVTMLPNTNIIPARILPSSSSVITAGSAVKLVAGAAKEILVDAVSGPTDGPVFGVVCYNMRKNSYSGGDVVEVAGAGSIIIMESSAAIERAAKVTATAATSSADPTVATVGTPSTQYVTGVALDKAASGALFRVQVTPSFNGTV